MFAKEALAAVAVAAISAPLMYVRAAETAGSSEAAFVLRTAIGTSPPNRTIGSVAGVSHLATVRTSDRRLAQLREFAAEWRRETAHLSSSAQRAMHPAYQRIIGHGNAALPFLFHELRTAPDHWFWALDAITGEDPVVEENQGDVEAMADAWLRWGADHGYA